MLQKKNENVQRTIADKLNPKENEIFRILHSLQKDEAPKLCFDFFSE